MRWHVLNKCRHKFSDLEPIVTKPPPEYPNVLWSEIRMEDNVNISTKSLLQPFYRIGNDLGSRPLCLDSHRSHRTRLCRQYIGIFLFCQVWDKQTSPCDQVISDILKQNLNFTFISKQQTDSWEFSRKTLATSDFIFYMDGYQSVPQPCYLLPWIMYFMNIFSNTPTPGSWSLNTKIERGGRGDQCCWCCDQWWEDEAVVNDECRVHQSNYELQSSELESTLPSDQSRFAWYLPTIRTWTMIIIKEQWM